MIRDSFRCGHPSTADNVYERPNGKRECRACKDEARRLSDRSLRCAEIARLQMRLRAQKEQLDKANAEVRRLRAENESLRTQNAVVKALAA